MYTAATRQKFVLFSWLWVRLLITCVPYSALLAVSGHLPRAQQPVQVLEVRVWQGRLLLSLSVVGVVGHGWHLLPSSYP